MGARPGAAMQFCEIRARLRTFPVLCPARYPHERDSSVKSSGTSLHNRGFYWASFNDQSGFPDGDQGHIIVGGQIRPFSLAAAPKHRWPTKGSSEPLGMAPIPRLITTPKAGGGTYVVQEPSTVLMTVSVNGLRGLALRAPPFPVGGLSGGHIIVVWNVDHHGYFVSLHLSRDPRGHPYSVAQRIQAALVIARSYKRVS